MLYSPDSLKPCGIKVFIRHSSCISFLHKPWWGTHEVQECLYLYPHRHLQCLNHCQFDGWKVDHLIFCTKEAEHANLYSVIKFLLPWIGHSVLDPFFSYLPFLYQVIDILYLKRYLTLYLEDIFIILFLTLLVLTTSIVSFK